MRAGRKPLDDQARELAEKNINLCHAFVNDYIKRNKTVLGRFRWSEDDVMSMAYIALCGAARDFDCGKGYKFSTLAYVAMRHEIDKEICKHLQNNRRVNHEALSLDAPIGHEERIVFVDTIVSCDLPPEDEYIERERIGAVNTAIREAALTGREREILRLHFSGMRQVAIARKLGITSMAVSAALKRAYARIKEYMEANSYLGG